METSELITTYGNLKNALVSLEIRMITDCMNKAYGNKARAARLLGIKRTTLVEKVKRYKIKTIYDKPKDHYSF